MRRVTITVPDDTLKHVQATVERGAAPSVSAYFARLAEERAHEDDLLALVDRLDAELGAPSPEDVAWASRVTHVER